MKKTLIVTSVSLVLFVGLSLTFSTVFAAPADNEGRLLREATDISSSLMSPFCAGRTIEACPSPKAGEWRQDIQQWVAQGVKRETIVARLQARVPEFNLSSYRHPLYGLVAPLLALLATSLLIFAVARRLMSSRRAGSGAAPVAPEKSNDEALAPYGEMLDAELRREV